MKRNSCVTIRPRHSASSTAVVHFHSPPHGFAALQLLHMASRYTVTLSCLFKASFRMGLPLVTGCFSSGLSFYARTIHTRNCRAARQYRHIPNGKINPSSDGEIIHRELQSLSRAPFDVFCARPSAFRRVSRNSPSKSLNSIYFCSFAYEITPRLLTPRHRERAPFLPIYLLASICNCKRFYNELQDSDRSQN